MRRLTGARRPRLTRWAAALASTASALALAAAMAPAAGATAAKSAAPQGTAVTPRTVALHRVGTVNLGKLAAAARRAGRHVAQKQPTALSNRPLRRIASSVRGAGARNSGPVHAALTGITNSNVAGEHGFPGITAPVSAAVNGGGDVSPPDQGLAVGPAPKSAGGAVAVEFVNLVLTFYRPNGTTIAGAIPANDVFGLPSSLAGYLADPRAYWDPATGHWFFAMFVFGDGQNGSPLGTQYIAVSETKNLFGPVAVYSIDTSDTSNTSGGCPCFGDFDMLGADANGIYITTNEFSVDHPDFNGTIIYAVSKKLLIQYAQGGSAPAAVAYPIGTSDPFGSYHFSPASTPQGAANPGTEYFIESNGNLPYDNHTTGKGLEVWALLHTSVLSTGGTPALVEKKVATESYSQPPNAKQKAGIVSRSNGNPEGRLQTDFNAVQEVTYANGRLYGELSTGFTDKSRRLAGVAWFVLKPTPKSTSIGVSLVRNGYLRTTQNLLYPVISVNKNGHGYMAFSLAGSGYFPSAAYVKFIGAPTGRVHVEAAGGGPLDDFTCYPGFSNGQCRYGDYSAAQVYNGRVYQATEYVQPVGDLYTNWATRVWSAPAP